jgi:hypothetical protein
MAGWSGDGDVHDVSRTPVVSFDPRLALGEGQRTLSWIWYTVSEQELQGNTKELEASEFLLRAWFNIKLRSRSSCGMGQNSCSSQSLAGGAYSA